MFSGNTVCKSSSHILHSISLMSAIYQPDTIVPVINVSICAVASRSDAREELESKNGL